MSLSMAMRKQKVVNSRVMSNSGAHQNIIKNTPPPPTSAKEGKDGSPLLSQKEKEERIRHFKDHQEHERQRRAHELEIASLQAQKNREHLEEERRKRMEELKQRELERRHAVEERKKQIWEADLERREAILRRNQEREARIEARRNAQRNTLCFAFGSSTPRTFDLELAALGGSAILLSSTSSRKHEDDFRKQLNFSPTDSRAPLPVANSQRAKSAGPDTPKSKPVPPPKPQKLMMKQQKSPIKSTETPEKKETPIKQTVAAPTPIIEAQQDPPSLTPPPSDNERASPQLTAETPKSRIISEEEAKLALAEKRRLAREQAEREAQLERERQEEQQRQEEADRLREEEEQRQFEVEQIRIAELQRKAEQERLNKAIEEQQAREEEERVRKAEEAKLKAEREEQEKVAKEEAEKQKKELEEKLRKEEIERAERKKRVEQIMSRTRGRGNSNIAQAALGISNQEAESENNNVVLNNGHSEQRTSKNLISNNQQHTNGFNNHLQESSKEAEQTKDNDDYNGETLNGTSSSNQHFEELIDLDSKNYIINADQVNSNIDTEHVQPPPFIAFEAKKPDLVDLLS